jgi:hypothetical protein
MRWDSISMDLITDIPITTLGHDSIVVFVDRLSKMMHAAACTKTVSAERLAEIFLARSVQTPWYSIRHCL